MKKEENLKANGSHLPMKIGIFPWGKLHAKLANMTDAEKEAYIDLRLITIDAKDIRKRGPVRFLDDKGRDTIPPSLVQKLLQYLSLEEEE
jgi:hypothetical protein